MVFRATGSWGARVVVQLLQNFPPPPPPRDNIGDTRGPAERFTHDPPGGPARLIHTQILRIDAVRSTGINDIVFPCNPGEVERSRLSKISFFLAKFHRRCGVVRANNEYFLIRGAKCFCISALAIVSWNVLSPYHFLIFSSG